MEYEWAREVGALEIARAVDIKQLYNAPGTVELKPAREPRDTPPPIVYDDEFGRAVLAFERIRTGRFIVPVFGITYQEDDKRKIDLTDLMHRDFYFAWNDFGGFSTLSTMGDPVVLFNHRLLQMSRNHLLALAHEMGHTWQGDAERDLWQVIGTKGSRRLQEGLKKKYPSLSEYVDDLALIADFAKTADQRKKVALTSKMQNVGRNGFNPRFIDTNLPELTDEILAKFSSTDCPLGPSHQPGFFNWVKANLPGIYDIFDPMGERIGWEFAIDLEDSGKINAGFHTDEERTLFMLRGLGTYDKAYGVDNYTRWLK